MHKCILLCRVFMQSIKLLSHWSAEWQNCTDKESGLYSGGNETFFPVVTFLNQKTYLYIQLVLFFVNKVERTDNCVCRRAENPLTLYSYRDKSTFFLWVNFITLLFVAGLKPRAKSTRSIEGWWCCWPKCPRQVSLNEAVWFPNTWAWWSVYKDKVQGDGVCS